MEELENNPIEEIKEQESNNSDTTETLVSEVSSENPELKTAEDENLQTEIDKAISENPEVENLEKNEEIVPGCETIYQLLKEINEKFDNKIAVDNHKNQLFDKMYGELQSYKDDLYKKMLKPLIMDIIIFGDNMRNLSSRYEEQPEESAILERYQQLRKEFLKIDSHIEDILYNNGIEAFVSKLNEEYNPRTQQAKKTSVTNNPEENKMIINSLAPGYIWDEQLFRREFVHVSVYEENNKKEE